MKKNKGFGVIGIIVVIATVLLIGVIVWKAWEMNKSQSQSPPSRLTDAAAYLRIKELGVKIKLDDKTKDVTYSATQSTNDEGVFIIDPTMKTIDEQYCSSSANPGMIGLLDRSKDAQHWGETAVTVDNIKSFKIGEYYYLLRGPQAECSQDSEIAQKRADHLRDFENVIKTIQADN